jgi:hypothetical protein
MCGLGRLAALPWLLIALLAQSLAPAEAAAMRPDLAALGICSAHGLGGAPHRPLPAKDQDHDCCAFACALASVAAVTPIHATPVRITFAAPADLTAAHCSRAPAPSPLERPRARAPPSSVLTI